MHKTLLFLIFVYYSFPAFPQSGPLKNFSSLSKYEKRWVMLHPFVAKKARRITRIAIAASDSMLKDSVLDKKAYGGNTDAFRHAFWMALLSQKIKPSKALALGRAHEKGNYETFRNGGTEDGVLPDSISCEMDLFNNKAGAEAGYANQEVSYMMLKNIIIQMIREKKLKIIKTDAYGNFLDCSGNKINVGEWKGKWGVPKCLVPSG